jgi:hypothetical protein
MTNAIAMFGLVLRWHIEEGVNIDAEGRGS